MGKMIFLLFCLTTAVSAITTGNAYGDTCSISTAEFDSNSYPSYAASIKDKNGICSTQTSCLNANGADFNNNAKTLCASGAGECCYLNLLCAGSGTITNGQCVKRSQCSVAIESGRCPGQAYCCPQDQIKSAISPLPSPSPTSTNTGGGTGCEYNASSQGVCVDAGKCSGVAVDKPQCSNGQLCCESGKAITNASTTSAGGTTTVAPATSATGNSAPASASAPGSTGPNATPSTSSTGDAPAPSTTTSSSGDSKTPTSTSNAMHMCLSSVLLIGMTMFATN